MVFAVPEAEVTDLIRSILMGIGCLAVMGVVSCSMLGAGAMVAADRAIERAEKIEAEKNDKGPWDK
jgi:threonine dehydrogenase-like Zn-dependent dehydrogenase